MRRKAISAALIELRTRMQLSQAELAAMISDQRSNNGHTFLAKSCVSRWEREQVAPSLAHRVTLQGIADAHGDEDLALIFGLKP